MSGIFLSMCDVEVFLTFASPNMVLLWQLFLPILFLCLNTVTVTAGTFEPWWEREVWRLGIWFNPPFLWKCLYQVRVIAVFTVFRLLIDFVCLYSCEFWLSLCEIVRSSVILLLPLFTWTQLEKFEDIKVVIRRRRTDPAMAKRKGTKGQTTIYKTYTYT
jgi:hypothetical protein